MPYSRWLQKFSPDGKEPEKKPLFSLVLLLRKDAGLPEGTIQTAAEKAFIDLLEQQGEGAVLALQSGTMTVVRAGEDMVQVVQMPVPYFEDRYAFAAKLSNAKARHAVLEHEAWLSIDYLSGRKRTEKNRVYIYRRLASFAAEVMSADLMKNDALALYFAHEAIVIPGSEQLKDQLEYFDSLHELFRWSEDDLH